MNDLERFEAKFIPEPNSGCWLWEAVVAVDRDGGARPGFRLNGKYRQGHRVSYELYRGPIPDGMHVCHTCDNGFCVNPDHLFLGSRQDNMDDMVKKGRQARGARHGSAKLSESQVLAIREDARVHRLIAQEYGVSQSVVSNIKTGKLWRHL